MKRFPQNSTRFLLTMRKVEARCNSCTGSTFTQKCVLRAGTQGSFDYKGSLQAWFLIMCQFEPKLNLGWTWFQPKSCICQRLKVYPNQCYLKFGWLHQQENNEPALPAKKKHTLGKSFYLSIYILHSDVRSWIHWVRTVYTLCRTSWFKKKIIGV